jgi:hypothetical protein
MVMLIDSAVDNQMFVAMCSPARDPNASYQAVSLLSPSSASLLMV